MGILRNGNHDAATPREGKVFRIVSFFCQGTKVTVPDETAPANYVPAAAIIREARRCRITGCKRVRRRPAKSSYENYGLNPQRAIKASGGVEVEVGGIPSVAVKYRDPGGTPVASGLLEL